MRSMFLAVPLLVGLGAGSAWADAREYIDKEAGFRVTVPNDWQTAGTPKGEIKLILVSNRFETTEGICPIAADVVSSSRSLTQDQINEGMKSQIDEAFWRDVITDEETKDVVIEEAGSELRNGRRVYHARARALEKNDGGYQPVQYRLGLHLLPGRVIMLMCGVKLEHVRIEDQAMTIIAGSLEPDSADVVALAPQPHPAARLVLFSGPRFDGSRRDILQASPNLPQAGWNVPAASLSVRGLGLWQVCSGANFSGSCQTLSGAASAAHGDRPLNIMSARPLASVGDPRSVVGLAADLGARTKRAAKPRRR